MELRLLLLVALLACAPRSKRLVLPDDMRQVTAGPPVSASQPAPARAATEPYADPFHAFDPFANTEDGTKGKAVPAAGSAPSVPLKKPAAQPLRAPSASSTPADQRYLLRLVEHGRVWEVELPEETGGYEVRIPLGSRIEEPTAADRELLGKDPKQVPAKSYLGTLAKIGEMYAAHHYELALIEVVDLEQQYPKDARLAAMKGSLFQRLGKIELAREAWKKALELDPSDTTVAEALRGLKGE